jgi:hypothetical protein
MERPLTLLTIVVSISLPAALACILLQPASSTPKHFVMHNERKVALMAISAQQLRRHIIRPALATHNLWSYDSEELLMLTAAQESRLGYWIHQLGNGPALSPWQIEPATFDWLRGKFPAYLGGRDSSELVYDLRLGALTARVRYLADPEKLPSRFDVEAMARMWKRVFNTSLGKGTWQEANEAYFKYVVREEQ